MYPSLVWRHKFDIRCVYESILSSSGIRKITISKVIVIGDCLHLRYLNNYTFIKLNEIKNTRCSNLQKITCLILVADILVFVLDNIVETALVQFYKTKAFMNSVRNLIQSEIYQAKFPLLCIYTSNQKVLSLNLRNESIVFS